MNVNQMRSKPPSRSVNFYLESVSTKRLSARKREKKLLHIKVNDTASMHINLHPLKGFFWLSLVKSFAKMFDLFQKMVFKSFLNVQQMQKWAVLVLKKDYSIEEGNSLRI